MCPRPDWKAIVPILTLLVVGCGAPSIQDVADSDPPMVVVVSGPDRERSVAIAGTDATGAPLDADVVWRIGSITKTFVAVAVMQLVDEGLVDLDEEVSHFLTSPLVPAAATVRDLLQHTSGVPDYTPMMNDVARSCPPRLDPFELLEGAAPLFAPGDRWEYSNTNYLILGRLLGEVSGTGPASVLRKRILDPLRLDDTYLEGSEPGPPPVPAVADFYDTGPGPITCTTPVWEDATDAGLVSSFDDLETFFRALFDGRLVSRSSLSAMLDTNEQGYGLGISRLLDPPVDGVEIYGNGGGVVGYKSVVLFETGSETMVMLMTPSGHEIGEAQTSVIEAAFR